MITRDEAIEKALERLREAESPKMMPLENRMSYAVISTAYSSLAAVLPVETTCESAPEEIPVPTGTRKEPRDYIQELIDFVSNHPDCKLEVYKNTQLYFRGFSDYPVFDKRNRDAAQCAREWLEILTALEDAK